MSLARNLNVITMAKRKNDSLMHEVQRLDAFVGITRVLNEKGLDWNDLSLVHKMRVSDYIFASVNVWDEVKNTNGYKNTSIRIEDAVAKWFAIDYAQVMGLSSRIVVLKSIAWANTKKVTLIYG